mmetsp:Transcript_44586/g.71363  ORF Transcript_44586/g.71363 Transcript_44586/m.71363 type:complete len:317 (+) Transcript_44586:30-980(+)|eukprot:CAMPEP_0197026648 /NCGR_PEP_ID=MMETSP1384-20130603/6696_1 /TAXON_ID=29189 /ORGANISM="Ammonia sp." /LENGTH=316 /DNA_ID=CAMNT_0042455349 /DNA_START=22 /DNA_END=972 /DNA_ORIENTATION=+
MFGYDDPEYGKGECLVHGKEFWPVASPYFLPIAYAALLYIPLFSIWRLIFEWLIDGAATNYAQAQQLKKEDLASFTGNVKKYKEAYWKTVTNSFLMFYGFYALWFHSPQFWNPSLMFEAWPQEMSETNAIYYRLAIGYHGHRAIYGLFWEKRRVDFWAYLLHHWITMLLIVISWCVGLTQHGTIVLALHDSADVFLSGAKAFSYDHHRIAVIISFSLFTLSWISCRLTLYPLKIIYPMFVHKKKFDCHPLFWLIAAALCILMFLHLYWGKHIILYLYYMICKPRSKESMEDPRSNSETEDNGQEDENTKNDSKKNQ